jgi:hypothetical protein
VPAQAVDHASALGDEILSEGSTPSGGSSLEQAFSVMGIVLIYVQIQTTARRLVSSGERPASAPSSVFSARRACPALGSTLPLTAASLVGVNQSRARSSCSSAHTVGRGRYWRRRTGARSAHGLPCSSMPRCPGSDAAPSEPAELSGSTAAAHPRRDERAARLPPASGPTLPSGADPTTPTRHLSDDRASPPGYRPKPTSHCRAVEREAGGGACGPGQRSSGNRASRGS